MPSDCEGCCAKGILQFSIGGAQVWESLAKAF